MKTMTCKQLGGVCDQEFRAETFEELVEQSKQHGMEMFAAQEPGHLKVAEQVMELMQNPEKMQAFQAEIRAHFDQLADDAEP